MTDSQRAEALRRLGVFAERQRNADVLNRLANAPDMPPLLRAACLIESDRRKA